MLSTKLGLSAVLMELAAWSGPVLFNSHSDAALISYLIAHAIASTLLALLILPLLRGEQARPRTPILAFLALCSYTVPIAGFLGVFAGLLVLRYYRSPATHSHFDSLQLPEFDQHQRVKGGFRQTGLRSFLGNTEVPMDSRMRAMVSLQHVSGRVASPLLRNVLNDTSEDLRLLAYGMLDTLEQRISRSVDHELQAWRVALATEGQKHPGPLTLKAAQNLSDLYWEFIYQGLAQGDLREYVSQESLRYCEIALALQPDNAQLCLRRGLLLHALGRLEEAAEAYDKAHSLGLPATRVLPYQAELSFEQRDFARTREIMQRLDQWSALPRLRPVIDYWSAR